MSPQNNVTVQIGNGVFITNEGNYNGGNASVFYYSFSTKMVSGDRFQPANGRPLGDVCQSMLIYNNNGYVVVNNSGKIEVVNPVNFKSSATITGLQSPRYILPVSSSKAYVTDLYANAVSIINLNSNTVTGKIPCAGWTEELTLSGNHAFVCNIRKSYVYMININTDMIDDSVKVNASPVCIHADKNGKLWVLCNGDTSQHSLPALCRIDPNTKQTEVTFNLKNAASPSRLRFNSTLDTLYYLNNGIYQLPVLSSSLPSSPLVSQGTSLFYGLGIAPVSGNIYVSDAIDYVQNGNIYIFNSATGKQLSTFKAGVIPGDFCFY